MSQSANGEVNINNKDIDCPYPYIAPDISKIKENITLTKQNCTDIIGSIYDPDLLVAQIILSVFWFVMMMSFVRDVYQLLNDKKFTTAKQFRLNVAALGSLLAFLQILYWVFHEARVIWSYKINLYLDELSAFTMYCMAIEMVDLWAALAKIRVKLRVSKSGITRVEKAIMILLAFTGLVAVSAFQIFGPNKYFFIGGSVKFFFAGISATLLALRAAVVIFLLHREISEMNSSKNSTHSANAYSMWPLRLKFFIFFVVLVAFAGYAFSWVYFNNIPITPPERTSNRSNTFSVSESAFLYIFGASTIFLQFSSTAACCRRADTDSETIKKVDNKNSITPSDTHPSSNHQRTDKNEIAQVVRESSKDITGDHVAIAMMSDIKLHPTNDEKQINQ